MEPLGLVEDLTDMKQRALTAACVAALVTGCASHAASVASPPTSASVVQPGVEISLGSPTPTDSASMSREQAVRNMLEQLLDEVHAPPGSTDLHGATAGSLSAPPQWEMSDDFIDIDRSWRTTGTVGTVLGYEQAHVPVGLTLDGSSSGNTGGDSVFYTSPAGALDEGAKLLITAVADHRDGVDLRVDAQDIWRPSRSAAERVPATVSGAAVVRKTGQVMPDPPPTVTTQVLDAPRAQRIASMLNALPAFANGAPSAGGGPNTVLIITFTDSGTTWTFTTGDGTGESGEVQVEVGGSAQPSLSEAGPLLVYLDSLFGVVDNP